MDKRDGGAMVVVAKKTREVCDSVGTLSNEEVMERASSVIKGGAPELRERIAHGMQYLTACNADGWSALTEIGKRASAEMQLELLKLPPAHCTSKGNVWDLGQVLALYGKTPQIIDKANRSAYAMRGTYEQIHRKAEKLVMIRDREFESMLCAEESRPGTTPLALMEEFSGWNVLLQIASENRPDSKRLMLLRHPRLLVVSDNDDRSVADLFAFTGPEAAQLAIAEMEGLLKLTKRSGQSVEDDLKVFGTDRVRSRIAASQLRRTEETDGKGYVPEIETIPRPIQTT